MDHNQQMEVLRLESPEELGGERYGRILMAVENVLNATASVDTLSEEHYAVAGAALVSGAEKFLQNTAMLNKADVDAEEKRVANEMVSRAEKHLQDADILHQAESVVNAEAQRIESGRQQRDTHDQIQQIREDIDAAMPTSFKDNPLFKVDV